MIVSIVARQSSKVLGVSLDLDLNIDFEIFLRHKDKDRSL